MHARLGERLYLHGSTGSGPMLAAAGARRTACPSASRPHWSTAWSWRARACTIRWNSGRSSRSATRAWCATRREGACAGRVLDHVAAGRSTDSRPPNARELAATAVLALELVEVSAKVRTGGPVDDAGRPRFAVLGWDLAAQRAAGIADSRRRPRSGHTAAGLPRGLPPGLSAWIELCPTTLKSRGW